MKKKAMVILTLPLLLAACVSGNGSIDSAIGSDLSSVRKRSSSSSSFFFGSNPISNYAVENGQFVGELSERPYHVRSLMPTGSRLLFGPTVSFAVNDSWIDVEAIGQKDIAAGVKGPSSGIINYAYGEYESGIFLDGRKFPGVDSNWFIYVYISEEACRDPDECFIRFVSHPKDDRQAITGCSVVVVYPVGGSVEADSEDANINRGSSKTIEPGQIWLDWKMEAVGDGIFFPKVDGKYQDVDINRVNAELDIMVMNAKGRYFVKNS